MAASPRQIAQQMARRYLPNPRDQAIFLRQMGAEANFHDETSPAGAQGYAQIMPATAQSWGVSNPHDPVQAFRAAASHMAGYLHQYGGSWAKALTAYNAGPGRVGGPLPAETQNYIRTILGGGDVKAASGAASGASGGLGALQTVQTPTFDERAFKQAQRRFALGQLLAGQGQEKGNPLFAAGLVTTTAPNARDFSGTKLTTTRAPAVAPASGAGGGGGTFPLPANSGYRIGALDQGVDIAAPAHTPLRAVGSGTIVGHGINGFGQWAPILRLDNGQEVYYGHAGPGNQLPVGTRVKAGQVIGEVGAGIVGISTGPHLEIGFARNGAPAGGQTAKAMLALINRGRGR